MVKLGRRRVVDWIGNVNKRREVKWPPQTKWEQMTWQSWTTNFVPTAQCPLAEIGGLGHEWSSCLESYVRQTKKKRWKYIFGPSILGVFLFWFLYFIVSHFNFWFLDIGSFVSLPSLFFLIFWNILIKYNICSQNQGLKWKIMKHKDQNENTPKI